MMKKFVILMMALTFTLQAREQVDTVEELREMQQQVRAVVEKSTPATVGLFSYRTGGSGSGVIVTKEGLILTAAHVVDGSQEVEVIFPDGETVQGKVLGMDRTKDQGMVQIINEGEWPHVDLGSSLERKPGDWVVALGHPGGYDPVRMPPVRLGRILSINSKGFFTTDCKLIGGDSGGPLFDLEGKLVGIHSSIGGARTVSVNNHAGISDFQKSWKRLKFGDIWGDYKRKYTPDGPLLGIVFRMVPQRGGVIVEAVAEMGPAAKVGIRPGDRIIGLGEEPIRSPQDLQLRISQHRAGDQIKVKVVRRRQVFEVIVTLAMRADVNK